MADPISLSALVIGSGFKIASSITKYLEEQKRAKLQTASLRTQLEKQSSAADEEERIRCQRQMWKLATDSASGEILMVMIILGQRLLMLEIVNLQHVPAFSTLVEQNLPDSDWTAVHDKLDQTLKYTAAIAMYFCAECAPMHIYRGFGAAIQNNWRWACPVGREDGVYSQEERAMSCVAGEMDNMLAKLKSIPRAPVLTKVPKELATVTPEYTICDLRILVNDKSQTRSARKQFKKGIETVEAYTAEFKHAGHPPLKNGQTFEAIRHLWATWDSEFCCKDVWEDLLEIAGQQADPGRMLYAFTISGFLDRRPGEIVGFADTHIESIVRWLHGCPGMTFRLVENNDVDWSSFKLRKATKKAFQKFGVDIDKEIQSTLSGTSIIFDPELAAKQAGAAQRKTPIVQQLLGSPSGSASSQHSYFGGSPPSYSETTTPATSPDCSTKSPISQAPIPRRRPAPTPPRPVLRKTRAVYDFQAEEQGELSVKMGDLLDVLKEVSEDGWVEVRRLDGSVGVVPEGFTSVISS